MALRANSLRFAFLLPALLALAGCATPPPLHSSHPLAERVWDVRAQRFATPREVMQAVAAADVALLGETHDNPRHHEIQADLLKAAVDAGRRPALGMEQIDLEWQGALDAARPSAATPEAIAQAARVASTWKWPLYEPIVAVALAHRLPIVALNLSRAQLREAVDKGGAPPPRGWGEAQRSALRAVLVASHCGQDNPIIDRMVDMQRLRDAAMAEALAAHAERGIVAIVGRGHARADFGVPLHLAERLPGRRWVSVALVEVDPETKAAPEYPEAAAARHDYLWFTGRAPRPDPCKEMLERRQ